MSMNRLIGGNLGNFWISEFLFENENLTPSSVMF